MLFLFFFGVQDEIRKEQDLARADYGSGQSQIRKIPQANKKKKKKRREREGGKIRKNKEKMWQP